MNRESRRPGLAPRRRWRRGRVNPVMTVLLVVFWVALWGGASVLVALGGILVAVLAQIVFPLPPLRLDGRVRPFALIGFLGYFVWQTLIASIDVSRHVLRLRREPLNAVIEVDLRSSSDLILTIVGIVTSLIPGSVVVEARRSTHTLFIHALGVDDAAGVERERARVLDSERRLIRAIGEPDLSADDQLAGPPPDGGRGGSGGHR